MKAIVFDRRGGPDVLRFISVRGLPERESWCWSTRSPSTDVQKNATVINTGYR